ncbi:acetoacetate decarboxylase family protein [Salipiger thiooxidans]|uniref:acetoacetate decarboxylase family protein n=1 Tax=Salipiger thiooxidans TaxID=282683 RepID=UPI001CD43E46|nr:acetoacetate decarboxylase family protein [Salipiger thiooxidans]MCA0850528.1 acetoacetate decarboxylase family protein [Salipiger thiooxidans]
MNNPPDPTHRYRMPTVFGPAVGPRQKPGGGMWMPEETGTMNAEWMAITYRTDAERLERLLPPGMALRGEPVLTVSCAWFKNLYWLAGRGYGILSVDFPVTYKGKSETLDGSFCPVIWEGAPDAILTGRDEMGFPKLFCDMPEIDWDRQAGAASCSASWFGFKFFDIALTDMVEQEGAPTLPGSGGGAAMYYKYVPRTNPGCGGGADAAYVTTPAPMPGAGTPDAIKFDGYDFARWKAKGSFNWHRATFEQLPTTFHIVNTLADLPCEEITNVEMVAFSGPGIGIAVNSIRPVEPADDK